MTFTAVVVTHNSEGEVPKLIASVDRHLADILRIVFVDNASEDRTLETIRRLSPQSQLLAFETNVGFGPATNAGVRAADTDVVALLNPDTVVADSSLARLAELAQSERALFGPRLLNVDGSPQISAFPAPASWELGLIACWPGALLPRPLRERCEPWRLDSRLAAGWLSAACLVACRDLLLELGPFDERLPLFGEDIDLCVRARAAGVACVFAPDVARIVHLGSRSSARAFADSGMTRKIEARRWVVRNRLGARRARYDLATEFVLHADRWLVKRALGRKAATEALWLRSAVHVLRHPRSGDPESLS